jgi:hypothetical protein
MTTAHSKPALPAKTMTAAEQKLLTTVLAFKEAKLHPKWSQEVADAWDEFLERLARRLSDSGLFGRGIER